MSIPQMLQGIKSDLNDGGGADSLTQSLKKLAGVTRNQYLANQSLFQTELRPVFSLLRQSIKKHKGSLTQQLGVQKYLKMIFSSLPKNLAATYRAQGSRLYRQASADVLTTKVEAWQDNQINLIQNQIFTDAIVESDIANIDFSQNKLADPQQTAIQRSITSIKSLLQERPPPMTSPSEVPRSIQYLAKYAAIQKKIPIGQVTDMQGLSYIGIQKIDRGGSQALIPYQKNQIMPTNLPNIPIQFKYHANKTMNSWNKFVQNQAKFIQLVNEISTSKNRTQYVEKQFKNLTVDTFAAQTLATLVYYYVYIPLQKYVKMNQGSLSSKQSFYQTYAVGGTPRTNPLLLSTKSGRQLCKLLLNQSRDKQKFMAPQKMQAEAIQLLKGFQNKLNQKQIIKVYRYRQTRMLQAKAFFEGSGILPEVYNQLLYGKRFSSIKTRRFVLPSGFQNNQFISIVQKITKDPNFGSKDEGKNWDLVWGSQSLYCHDYIWQNKD